MRQDKIRRLTNSRTRGSLKTALTKARKSTTPANLSHAFSVIDQAAKKGIIHKSKAARLKSRLAKKAPVVKSTKKSTTGQKRKKT